MRFEVIFKHLGVVLLFNAIFMFIAAAISIILKETSALALLYSGLICLIFSLFPLVFSEKTQQIQFTEGLTIVVFGWLVTCISGVLPYIMWGGEFNLINAWFESVSGFTTTGSTILTDIETLPKGILFWRSSTQWIGGLGIIIFVLAILPKTASSSIYNAEVSSMTKLSFQLNNKKLLQVLIVVYVSLTFAQTTALTFAGMSIYDAINHSFTTISTGGFSTKNNSIAWFNSLWIELIIVFFMVLSALHFGLIYGTFTRKKNNLFRSEIVKALLFIWMGSTLAITLKLYWEGSYPFWEALRLSIFQVTSLGSNTGYATIDTAHWPMFTQLVLLYLMFQTGMSGSTSGGLKFDRIFIFFKLLRKQIRLLQHPRGIFITKINNQRINEQLEQQTLVFIVVYIMIFLASSLILSLMNIDGMTAFSASLTAISNCGPGFGEVSSMGNFSQIPSFGKFVLSINMLLGRLEVINVLALIVLRR